MHSNCHIRKTLLRMPMRLGSISDSDSIPPRGVVGMYLSVTPELKTTVNVALSFVFVVDAVYMCVWMLQFADLNSSAISSSGVGIGTHLMCNYCNYTSPKRYLLARHLKAHSEERPHKCTICSRMFKTIPALQNHVNTHTGVRPQHCKVLVVD